MGESLALARPGAGEHAASEHAASEHAASEHAAGAATLDPRRKLQLALSAIWLFDGILQYQPSMFTKAFPQMLGDSAHGNPGGLSVTECAELARRLGTDISRPALRSLVELTGGNPLAVLENLAGAARGHRGFEPERLTLGRVLEHAWGRVFAELPEDTQRALFVVATDGVSGGCHVATALGRLRLPLASLVPAERRGLVRALTSTGPGNTSVHRSFKTRTSPPAPSRWRCHRQYLASSCRHRSSRTGAGSCPGARTCPSRTGARR
jgi:hypothetical protein